MAGKVREFCLITSVKGIPRLLRTKSVVMRFVWTISVIGFLCMASFQAMLLTMEYFQYKTYTSTGEVIIDYFGQAGGFTGMPDITLCNANPYASNKNLSNDLLTLEGYYKLAEEATTCDNNCRDAEREPLQHIRHEIMSTRGYFNYIGRLNAKQLGHTFESFVVNCELDMEGGGVLLHSIPCLPTVQIIEIQHSMLYNCYTIRLPRNKFPDTVFRGFRAVLHLDDYEALHKEQTLLNPHGEPGQMSGVWMFAHERNKPLYTYYNRMMLQPGHYHDIPVKMELRTYLPPPHGLCEDMEGLDYSLLQCYFDCIQERIYEQCGCLDLQNYTSQWNPTVTKGPFCLSLSLNKSAMIKNWKCISRERPKAIAGCVASCPVPCKETRHNLRSSQTTWPGRAIHQNFYDLYIAGRSYEEHYRALFEQATNSRKRRDLYDEITDHFMAVHVYVEALTALDIRDKPQLTATSFLSQLGGALNLWAGITVVVVVEVIEFCYEVVLERFNRGFGEDEKSVTDQQDT